MKDSSDRIDRLILRTRERVRSGLAWAEGSGTPWIEIIAIGLVSVGVLYIVRNVWFFGDDWAMLTARRELLDSGQWVQFLFNPHNEHLSTSIVLVFTALESLFGVESAFPYLVVVILAHVGLLWVMRCFLVRWGVPIVPRILAIVWMGLLGSGAENLVWAFQAAYIGALALGLGGLYLVTGPQSGRGRNLAASLLFLLSLLTAGTALPVFAVSMLVIVWNRRWRQLLEVGAVPAGIYAAWFLLYGGSRQPEHPTTLTQVVPYMTRGIEFGLDQILQFGALGFVAGVAAVVLLAITDWFVGDHRITLVALVLGAVAFFALGGLGRGFYGADQAQAIRYVYVLGAFAIPVLVAIGARIAQKHHLFGVVALFFLAVAIIGNVGALISFRNARLQLTDSFKNTFSAATEYVDNSFVDQSMQIEPTYNPDVTVGRLRELRDWGFWRPSASVPERTRLDVAARLGLRVGMSPLPTGAVGSMPKVVTVESARLSTAADRCLVVESMGRTPAVVLAAGRPGTFTIDTGGGASSMVIRSETTSSIESGPVDLKTTGTDRAVSVEQFPVTGRPVILLPAAGSTRICGVEGP